MRVISGKCKGRMLHGPQNDVIRPTADKIKQFIFNYIGEKFQDTIILDLFSGTGNLAIEALSRGAQFAVLVDHSQEAIRLIYRNLELTNFLSQVQVIRQDVFRYLKSATRSEQKFNFIFADPPYSLTNYQDIIEPIDSGNLLHDDGFFILEHSYQQLIELKPLYLSLTKLRIFGDTAISGYIKKGA